MCKYNKLSIVGCDKSINLGSEMIEVKCLILKKT